MLSVVFIITFFTYINQYRRSLDVIVLLSNFHVLIPAISVDVGGK